MIEPIKITPDNIAYIWGAAIGNLRQLDCRQVHHPIMIPAGMWDKAEKAGFKLTEKNVKGDNIYAKMCGTPENTVIYE